MDSYERELLEKIAQKLKILGYNGCVHEWEPIINADYYICKKCGETRRG